MKAREFSSNFYRHGYQGSERDNDMKGQGNSYSTFFRQLDPRLGRWLTIDPVIQSHESPYISMGNNPIGRNDINGDKWKDKNDEATAKSISKSLNKREKFLDKRSKRAEERSLKAFNKGKYDKADRLCEKSTNLRIGAEEMRKAQSEIKEMGDSESNYFTFRKAPDNMVSYSYSETMDVQVGDKTEKKDVTVIEWSTYSNAIHELTHAYQNMTGQLQFVANSGGGYYADLTDEVQAYTRQFFYNPMSVKGLNSDVSTKIKTHKDITMAWIKGLYVERKDASGNVVSKEHPYSGHSETIDSRPGSWADQNYLWILTNLRR